VASLDPASAGGGIGAGTTTTHLHIFEPLATFEGQRFTQVPRLAESWRLLDERTWEFKLRRGVRFHNGDEFTARDVVYSFDLYRSEKSMVRTYIAEVADVEPIDPYTLKLTTQGPSPALLANLASVYILPRQARETAGEDGFANHPIGTGPYRFVEFLRGERLTLEANPDYWRGAVSPQRLILRPIADPVTRSAELKSGGVQIIGAPPLAKLPELDGGGTTLLALKGARTIIHPINTTTKPFDDVRVRQAVNFAIDRDAIIRDILEGHAEPLHGPFASAWLGYDRDLLPYAYDPARAKQLLAAAGYPNGLDTVFNVSNGVFLRDRDIAEVVARQLADVGIRVRLVPTERAKLVSDWYGGVFTGITSGAWGAAADPDPMLGRAFYKTKYQAPDERLTSLIEQSRRTMDPGQREKVLKELGQYIHEQAYWLFIHAQDEFYAKRTDVSWEPSASSQSLATIRYYATPPPGA
jgi:peptide/nickel transport system substrate-binding protein